MQIGDIFKKISELENHNFKIDKLYIPKTKFQLQDENKQWQDVVGMIVKEDVIYTITLDNYEFKCGSKHKLLSNGKEIFAKDLSIGDLIDPGYKIIDIKSGAVEQVYDISLNSDSHLYVDNFGIIHHNTFEVTQQLVGTNSESFKGGLTSASALYKMLFINNEKGKILIFDDLDVLLEDKECVNILKGALESSANPEVSYISNNTVHPIYYKALTGEYDLEDPKVIESLNALKIDIVNMNEKRLEVMKMRAMDPYSAAAILPNKFTFVAKVIFISNKYLDEIPGALLSRGGTKIEINLTLEEIVKRIEGLLPKLEVPVEPGTPGISMKEKQAAMDYCKKVLIPYGKIKKIDFRSFFDICRLASGDAPKELWHKWASVMLMETYGNRDTSIKRKKR